MICIILILASLEITEANIENLSTFLGNLEISENPNSILL